MSTNSGRKATIIGVLVPLLLLSSCATHFRTLKPESATIQAQLKVGDTVRILTKDDRVLTFKVVEITERAIVGEEQQVVLDEIAEIARLQTSLDESEVEQGVWNVLLPVAVGVAVAVALGLLLSGWASGLR